MAKRRVLTIFTFLLFPLAVLAQTNVVNSGGSVAFNSNELHGKSIMISYRTAHGADLGTVVFTTGSLASGSVEAGATFSEGGSFVIVGNGAKGVPKGTIFRGKFTGTSTWTLVTSANNKHSYTLTGAIQSLDRHKEGTVVELTLNVGLGYFHKSARLSAGSIALNP